ncbi:uncharacterized protein LOC103720798 isoform X2 [Phoenix dactylifera]|uniref:Uncharacterized protein LOC103720798 isoform X2 n=1 Tax=Phoenix dactylifera TaxID=42345 RepID=A0A8B9AFM6_PHODC|nr:uncharacterized protein LOC103720798 isoform X2 [Phoenix dactylifera]
MFQPGFRGRGGHGFDDSGSGTEQDRKGLRVLEWHFVEGLIAAYWFRMPMICGLLKTLGFWHREFLEKKMTHNFSGSNDDRAKRIYCIKADLHMIRA